MNVRRILFLFLLTGLALPFLDAQSDDWSTKYTLQIDLGFGSSFHFNPPAVLRQCFEGCTADEQKSRPVKSLDLSVYRRFEPAHELKLGLGYAEFSYWEKGSAVTGLFYESDFHYTHIFRYLNLQVGERFKIINKKSTAVFLENNLMAELKVNDTNPRINKLNAAYTGKFGCMQSINKKWSLFINVYFKTAVLSYSFEPLSRKYLPYSYGLNLGIAY